MSEKISRCFPGRDVSLTIGGKPISESINSDIELSNKPIHGTRTTYFSLNTVEEFSPPKEMKCTALVTYEGGRKLKISGMKYEGDSKLGEYCFSYDCARTNVVMKTKSKQPRYIEVWRKA